jgi:hypothetical protein
MAATRTEQTDQHAVSQFRVTHQLGGKTEILLTLKSGEQSTIETRDGYEAGLILNLLQKGSGVKYDIVSKNFLLDIVEQGGVQLITPSVEYWLNNNHAIRNAIIWETSSDTEAYKDWPQSRKDDLQQAFAKAWNFDSVGLVDPAPNILTLADDDGASTALSHHDALWLYLASVAQSLAVEIGSRVPWSISNYSSSNLAVIFDSREFYAWTASANGYQIDDSKGGSVVPSTPHKMYSFLRDNDLVGDHRKGTIVRTLRWCHDNMSHFLGSQTAGNCQGIWQYRGLAPVIRTIKGTTDQANPSYGVRHWTAGCHGTAGFLRAILRTVNMPVLHDHQEGHALPNFSPEHLHLSHGDDPYNALTFTDPQFSTSELLIDQTKYDAWFGSGVSDADKQKNVGRRTQELAIQYLPNYLLHAYCNDKAAGKTHANGSVKDNLGAYTVAQLEAQHLWANMDAKIASLGGCDQVPY